MCKYAVVDLEMCKVPYQARSGTYRWPYEIIQIGAVLLNEVLEVENKFVTYVSPQFGYVDMFIRNLTGIQQKDVRYAPVLKTALQKFVDWLPNDVKAVSWSNDDLLQIRRELDSKSIKVDGLENILENWIDCQKIFGEKLNMQRRYRLSEALVAADIMYEEGAHDGLVDAYNTALLFAKMEKEPKLKLNPHYKRVICDEADSGGFSIGSLFDGIDLEGIAAV